MYTCFSGLFLSFSNEAVSCPNSSIMPLGALTQFLFPYLTLPQLKASPFQSVGEEPFKSHLLLPDLKGKS